MNVKIGTCWIVVGLAAGAVPFLAGCGNRGQTSTPKPKTVAIQNCGSDTMVNLAQMWSEAYKKAAPDVSVEVGGGGSGVGIRDLMQGIVDIANASRKMKESERAQTKKNTGKEPVEWIVGYDAMAIYVHKDNPVKQLSIEQLARIYGEGGDVDKWSQLGIDMKTIGASDEIVRVSRQNSSGTYFFFREHVLDKKDFKLGSRDMSGSKDVVELVGRTPGAIGYSGMGYRTDEVKFVPIVGKDGSAYEPSLANVVAGTYSLARPLHMYTLGQPTGHIKKYIDWVLSADGQAIVKDSGYVPVAAAEGK
ncbi:MAG: phosphate ABC transporter substrate-binding protein [Kiritimatiellae bacterium]|nr:phosphate ABC transporter substrate-binding protein [Kiritimatiellia bacterium]